jgi:hypothetical protein
VTVVTFYHLTCLFSGIHGIRYNELTDDDKQAILYYVLYMKEANKVPLEMSLKELRKYALNIPKVRLA